MQIKWDIFTQEEREIIEALLAKKEFDSIAKAFTVNTPEKEFWLQVIIDQNKPIVIVKESEVEKDLKLARHKGEEIMTPEKEAEWQKKKDEETETFKEEAVKEVEKRRKALEPKKEAVKKEEPKEPSDKK